MDRNELVTHLKVLAARTQQSEDDEVRCASVVLHSLTASLLAGGTPLLAQVAAEHSMLMMVVMGQHPGKPAL
jgi:hypothetical protein